MTPQGLVSINSQISTPETARISAFDRGFLHGEAVFETLVAFGTQVLDIPEHLHRLRQSALKTLGLEISLQDEQLDFEMQHLVASLAVPKTSLRLMLTPGPGSPSQLAAASSNPSRVIFAQPAPTLGESYYATGLNLATQDRSKFQAIQANSSSKPSDARWKIRGLQQAQARGVDELLWLHPAGEVTETSTANIFFLGRQGSGVEILTPTLTSGALAGITRKRLLELLAGAQIRAREEPVESAEIPRFDEAFVCSTVRGLVPVHRIDDHRLHTTRKNSIFSQIRRLFMAHLEARLGKRVNWDSGLSEVQGSVQH